MNGDVFVAGDTLDNQYGVEDFPSSDGWTLRIRLIPNVSGSAIDLTSTPDPDGKNYLIQAGPSDTALWAAGDYSVARWVEKTGYRKTVDPQPAIPPQLRIVANPATATAFDSRSDARRNLANIEAFLAGRATNAVQEYEINGRRLVNYKPVELIQLADYYRRQVANENRSAALASGLGNPRHVYVRFR